MDYLKDSPCLWSVLDNGVNYVKSYFSKRELVFDMIADFRRIESWGCVKFKFKIKGYTILRTLEYTPFSALSHPNGFTPEALESEFVNDVYNILKGFEGFYIIEGFKV